MLYIFIKHPVTSPVQMHGGVQPLQVPGEEPRQLGQHQLLQAAGRHRGRQHSHQHPALLRDQHRQVVSNLDNFEKPLLQCSLRVHQPN